MIKLFLQFLIMVVLLFDIIKVKLESIILLIIILVYIY